MKKLIIGASVVLTLAGAAAIFIAKKKVKKVKIVDLEDSDTMAARPMRKTERIIYPSKEGEVFLYNKKYRGKEFTIVIVPEHSAEEFEKTFYYDGKEEENESYIYEDSNVSDSISVEVNTVVSEDPVSSDISSDKVEHDGDIVREGGKGEKTDGKEAQEKKSTKTKKTNVIKPKGE